MRARFVNEHINFEKKRDPLSSLGVGQRKLIEDWLEEMDVKNYTINDDLTIDVNGSVDLNDKDLTKFPNYIQFNEIFGYFDCSENQLTSLRGCPRITYDGYFSCSHNKLTNLDFCPEIVAGSFDAYDNEVEFSEEYIRLKCNIKGKVYMNLG